MKSTILTEEAMLASMPLAMQGTCNSLNLLSSFSDGLLSRLWPLGGVAERIGDAVAERGAEFCRLDWPP